MGTPERNNDTINDAIKDVAPDTEMASGKKKRWRLGPVRTVIFVVFLLVFLVSAGMLAKDYFQGQKAQNDFTKLVVEGDYDLKALHEQNGDIVGWLQIKDTKINYPIMQTKKVPEYYLRRNFQK